MTTAFNPPPRWPSRLAWGRQSLKKLFVVGVLLTLAACSAGSTATSSTKLLSTKPSPVAIPGRTIPATLRAVIAACPQKARPLAEHSDFANACAAPAVTKALADCNQLGSTTGFDSAPTVHVTKDLQGPHSSSTLSIVCDWNTAAGSLGLIIAVELGQPWTVYPCTQGEFAHSISCIFGSGGLDGVLQMGISGETEELETENLIVSADTAVGFTVDQVLSEFGFTATAAAITQGSPYVAAEPTIPATTSAPGTSTAPAPTGSSIGDPSAQGDPADPASHTDCGMIEGTLVWAGPATSCAVAAPVGRDFLTRLSKVPVNASVDITFSETSPVTHRRYAWTCEGADVWKCSSNPEAGTVYVGFGS